jgi:hypothetical protein
MNMRKLRGRRIVLLLAGALPLLAKDDIPIVSTAAVVGTTSTATTTIGDEHGVVSGVVRDKNDGEHDLAIGRLRSAAQHEQQEFLLTTFDDQSIPKNDDTSWAGFPFDYWSDEFGQGHCNTVIPLRPPPFLPNDLAFGGNLNQTRNEKPPERIRLEIGTEANEVIETMKTNTTKNEEKGLVKSEANANATTAITSSVEVEKNTTSTITDTSVNITTAQTTNEEEIPAATTEKASTATNKVLSTDADDNTVKDATNTAQRVVVDYASKSAGALILEKSTDFQGTSNLLNSDKDQYAIIPCEHASKFVVVGLSEDILVKQVVLANYERYSSQIKEFNILGSQTIGHWVDLGTYQAALAAGKQTFDLKEPSWARYLKFRFLSHFGDEHYCTVSQISVHGSTMVQGFHEQWEESEAEEDASADSATADDTVIATTVESDEAVAPPIATNEAVGEIEVVSATTPSDQSSSFSSVQCVVSKLSGVCPDEWGFEQNMHAFNYSDSNLFGALPLVSIYLASSQSAKSNFSASESSLFHKLDRTAIVETLRKSRDGTHLVANQKLQEQATAALKRSLRHTSVSPIIHRIQNMIKSSATGVDVNVNLDNAMWIKRVSSSKIVSGGEKVEAGSEKINPVGVTSVSKPAIKEEKKEEATPLQPQVPPKEVSPTVTVTVTVTVPPQTPPATGVENVATKVSVPEKKEETSHEALHETGSALANVLERFPNAACLGELDFAKFKAKILSARASNTNGSGQSAGGGTVEPIFKKLADEIRTLQTSVSVHDQFAKSSIACYQRVMLDLVVELEAVRVEQDARISKIEQELFRGTQWTAVFQGFFQPVVYGVSSTLELLVSSLIFHEGKTILDCVQWVVGLVFTVFVYRVVVSAGSRKRKLPA